MKHEFMKEWPQEIELDFVISKEAEGVYRHQSKPNRYGKSFTATIEAREGQGRLTISHYLPLPVPPAGWFEEWEKWMAGIVDDLRKLQ